MEAMRYTNTSAPFQAPRFAVFVVSPHFPFFPRYPSVSHDIPRHPSAPHAAGLPIPTWGVEEQKALPGAAAAVLAHGDDDGRLSKCQAPWVFTTEGNPVVSLVTGPDDT